MIGRNAELRPEVRSAEGRSDQMIGRNAELRPEVRSPKGRSDHTTIRARACRDWAEAAPVERIVAVLLGVVALAIRLAHVRQTMRHDEAYTYLHYARAPLS